MAQPKILGTQIDQATLSADDILPSQTGNSGKVLGTDGTNASWVAGGGGGGGSPGGGDTQVQYNSSGSFAGSAALAWDNSTNTLTVGVPQDVKINLGGDGYTIVATDGFDGNTNVTIAGKTVTTDTVSYVGNRLSLESSKLTSAYSTHDVASAAQVQLTSPWAEANFGFGGQVAIRGGNVLGSGTGAEAGSAQIQLGSANYQSGTYYGGGMTLAAGYSWDGSNFFNGASISINGASNGTNGGMDLSTAGNFTINGDPGTSGYVLTSQGSGVPPQWLAGGGGGGGGIDYEPMPIGYAFDSYLLQAGTNSTVSGITSGNGGGDNLIFWNGTNDTGGGGAPYSLTVTGASTKNIIMTTAANSNVTVSNKAEIVQLGRLRNSSIGVGAIGIGATTISGGFFPIAIGNSASASTNYSIAIGFSTIANGTNATSVGGSATASTNSTVVGYQSQAAGSNSVAIGQQAEAGSSSGRNNNISVGYQTSSGGSNGSSNNLAVGYQASAGNSVNATHNIAIGASTLIGATGSNVTNNIGIGRGATSDVTYVESRNNSVIIGSHSTADFNGQYSFSNQRFTTSGDIIVGHAILYGTTTAATTTELMTGINTNPSLNPTSPVVLRDNSAYIFDCDIVARENATDDTSTWNLKFAIKRGANAAATVLMGTPTATLIAQDSGASAWTVAVTADTTNGRPNISVTGEAAKTIRWVSNTKITKVAG